MIFVSIQYEDGTEARWALDEENDNDKTALEVIERELGDPDTIAT